MIRVENLSIKVGEFDLRNISFSIKEREYFVILGPTGAGKTVLIEGIAGLLKIKQGKVWLNNIDITNFPPEQRGIGYLPQDYCLFPHLNVRQNIEFGLKISGCKASEREKRVDSLSELLKITPILDRSTHNLSGGEKQRVALARALALYPSVLLLDEPLCSLDESLRSFLAGELRRIQQETGSIFIHICHNFDEALDVADKVGIINNGEIIQVGSMREVFRSPDNLFVARFVKMSNIFRGKAVREGEMTSLNIGSLNLFSRKEGEGEVYITIRPEDIHISHNGTVLQEKNSFPGKIISIIDKGAFLQLEIDAGIMLVAYSTLREMEKMGVTKGDKISVSFEPENLHLFKDKTEPE